MKLSLPTLSKPLESGSHLAKALIKNFTEMLPWAENSQTNCFRLYDRDESSYPLTIDLYGNRFCIHYFAPARNQDEPPQELMSEVSSLLVQLFNVKQAHIYWKTRKKSKESRQYEKVNTTKEFFTVVEYGVRFEVNLLDYIDTGLFLDHRETRQIVAALVRGKRLLNLFAYTCSFSVQAAFHGAMFTKSVDLSNTYTEWGEGNFWLNGLPLKSNHVIRADCLKFLDSEIRSGVKYDLIVVDPPTISRSKKMDQMFDVHKDYPMLLTKALRLLAKGGTLFFSTNSQKFFFDGSLFKACSVLEITDQTIPADFQNSTIHRCWKISN